MYRSEEGREAVGMVQRQGNQGRVAKPVLEIFQTSLVGMED
jgi:hypothetical protein